MIEEKKKRRYLCYDVIFKAVFQEYPNILAKMIADIADIDYDLLKDNIRLEANELPIQRENEKFKKCDFIIRIDNNKIINLELNRDSYTGQVIKNLSYLCNLFSTFTKKGKKYDKNLLVMQINIDCFDNLRQKEELVKYYIKGGEDNNIYVDNLAIYTLNLVNCHKLYYNKTNENIPNYVKWGTLLYCDNFNEFSNIIKGVISDKERKILMDKLENITKDDYFMSESEALEWADWMEASIYDEGLEKGIEKGIEQGIEKGIQKNQLAMIKSMLENHIDLKTISKVTNKSIEEIQNIIKNN